MKERNPIVMIIGIIILFIITRNIWLNYGRVIPYFGIIQSIIVVGIILICASATRIILIN